MKHDCQLTLVLSGKHTLTCVVCGGHWKGEPGSMAHLWSPVPPLSPRIGMGNSKSAGCFFKGARDANRVCNNELIPVCQELTSFDYKTESQEQVIEEEGKKSSKATYLTVTQ